MNHPLLVDVEQAVAGGDGAARQSMLDRVTDLFVGVADRIDDDQVEAFDVVLHRLIGTVGPQARASLSDRLADIPNAPRSVVRDLAYDAEVSVAAPILSRSTRLDEDDLVILAAERGQDHLHALAKRKSLSERVSDVLVTRGDRSVVHAVAANQGARLSGKGFETIVARSRTDDILRDTIGRRSDVPKACWPALRKPPAPVRSNPAAVCDEDEKRIAAWFAEDRITECLDALAGFSGTSVDRVRQAYEATAYEPLLYLVRSVGFGWGIFKLFLLSKPGPPPSPEDLRGAFAAFQAMPVATAMRVVTVGAHGAAPRTPR
ncbi:DUF2336 domain-containing protein [Methylobacterium sp. Leaf466]|uniref:DUF2336 domain-containing protein n=1 Tax=Methylobacterium sp. Leaf466 TaxID=1736386 RepID=UPI0007005B7A|nr:DUF2336 domain-containing protein [Methylobacterium sp. Leaf466]KQT76930.1 hypothetical protein ASG59_13330 [Methylobacterium sp. Leaf466]